MFLVSSVKDVVREELADVIKQEGYTPSDELLAWFEKEKRVAFNSKRVKPKIKKPLRKPRKSLSKSIKQIKGRRSK